MSLYLSHCISSSVITNEITQKRFYCFMTQCCYVDDLSPNVEMAEPF